MQTRQITFNIKHNGDRVVFLKDGALIEDMPWDKAIEIGRALIAIGRKAEEYAKATEIIHDQAILTRAGWPFMGLSADPRIQAEAAKEAAWNSDLRRYLPGGVKSEEALFPPSVIRHAPRLEEDAPQKGVHK